MTESGALDILALYPLYRSPGVDEWKQVSEVTLGLNLGRRIKMVELRILRKN